MTTTANPKLEAAELIFKDLVWDSLVNGTLAYLFASAPYLNVWPLRQTITSLAQLFSGKMFDLAKLTIDVQAITFINAQHKRAYDDASVKLRIIAHNCGVDSEEFRKAKDEAKIALSKFVAFGK